MLGCTSLGIKDDWFDKGCLLYLVETLANVNKCGI